MSTPNNLTSRIRRHPLSNYLLLLMLTVGAYWLYSTLIVPKIEPATALNRVRIASDVPEYQENQDHHRWFKNGDWELNPCSILHTAHGKILFQDHQVEDSKTWFVTPFSLVLQRENEMDSTGHPLPPLVLRCASGARLFFNGPILTKPASSGNRLESALLEGAVELYRLSSQENIQDGLRIETSNVQINDEQILTIDDVAFWIGPNHGIGRNMKIHLTNSSSGSSVTRDFSGIDGIKYLQLGFLSSLQIRPPSKTRRSDHGKILSNDTAPIEIQSSGPFEFDMETHQALFTEKVQVRKLDGKGDALFCDKLEMQFKATDGSKSIKLDATADVEFELQSITALGSPAIFQATSRDARIQAQRLSYFVPQQIVRAEGTEQVDVRQGTSRFVASNIEYQLTDDNSIGPLTAMGPGILIRADKDRSFRATWRNKLTVERISNQQHLVEVDGDAKLKLDRQTSIEADKMRFQVWQVPVMNPDNRFVDWAYQPNQLNANGNVKIQSEELQGETLRLVAQWPNNPVPAQQQIDRAELGQVQNPVQIQPVPRSLVRRVNFDQEPPSRRLRFRGEHIEVALREVNQKTEMIELQIKGDVTVTKPSQIANVPTFKVRGSSLKMLPQGNNLGPDAFANELYQVQVEGSANKAARLTSQRLDLVGPKIVLDQQANHVWVNGAGNMMIQSDRESSADSSAKIDFSGGMIFDGQKIYFERDVAATIRQNERMANKQLTQVKAAVVILKLDQGVNLQENQETQESDVQVVEMLLKDRIAPEENQFRLVGFEPVPVTTVQIESEESDQAGNLVERFSISAVDTFLDQTNNTIKATGPGSVTLLKPGSADIAGLPPAFSGNRQRKKTENKYTYIRSHFDRQLTANMTENELVIQGNTRSVFAPVADPSVELNPDRPATFSTDAISLSCQRLDVKQSPNPYDGKLQSRIIASNRAQIVAPTYKTTADRIRYDEAADELVVESASGRDVVLYARQNPRSGWQSIVGKRVTYQLSTQSASAKGVQQINASLSKRP